MGDQPALGGKGLGIVPETDVLNLAKIWRTLSLCGWRVVVCKLICVSNPTKVELSVTWSCDSLIGKSLFSKAASKKTLCLTKERDTCTYQHAMLLAWQWVPLLHHNLARNTSLAMHTSWDWALLSSTITNSFAVYPHSSDEIFLKQIIGLGSV